MCAEHEAGAEDDGDDEHRSGDDADPRGDLVQPAGRLLDVDRLRRLRGLRSGCRRTAAVTAGGGVRTGPVAGSESSGDGVGSLMAIDRAQVTDASVLNRL